MELSTKQPKLDDRREKTSQIGDLSSFQMPFEPSDSLWTGVPVSCRIELDATDSTAGDSFRLSSNRIVIGGLHTQDFFTVLENPPEDYLLVCFKLGPDRYHWQAVFQLNEDHLQ
jgi:hypothetical protein